MDVALRKCIYVTGYKAAALKEIKECHKLPVELSLRVPCYGTPPNALGSSPFLYNTELYDDRTAMEDSLHCGYHLEWTRVLTEADALGQTDEIKISLQAKTRGNTRNVC
jgi:hypothetical protein